MDRKLAAILAADVVGYAALMERDEKGTHESLVTGRKELFEPEIARHHGRIFKLMGDGLLAEFSSVVDAVECAVALQRGLAERNAEVPQDERIQVRIGINMGEVIVEGGDRFGEGVNGTASLTRGTTIEAGHPVLHDRDICFWWRKDGVECAVIYRNPNGTHATGDEFVWINPWTRWAFSVVK
jgi:class 3 adenylate cyclase